MDTDDVLKDEIASMRGSQMFASFYEQLNLIRDYHQKFPNLEVVHVPALPVHIDVRFSGEEVFGKFLDLNENFQRFSNLPNIGVVDQDYLQYLDKFNSFFYIPESAKGSKQYKQYLDELWTYLSNFFIKIQPLANFEEISAEWSKEFDEKWKEGKISGWKSRPSARVGEPQALRLGMFNAASELEALGMERLKEALEAIGLKCGGTLKDRAERLWSVRGVSAENYPEKLKAKPAAGNKRKLDEMETSNGQSNGDSRLQQVFISAVVLKKLYLVIY